MITPSATAPALTDGKNYEYIFRVTGRDDQQGPAAAQYILDVAKPKKVAILHDKQSYGQGIANAVRVTLEKAGLKPVLFEGINAGDADYSAIITKLRSQGVDFVYYGGYHPEMGLLLRQAAEQGVKAKFMGPEGAGNPDINAIAGNAVEGMLLTVGGALLGYALLTVGSLLAAPLLLNQWGIVWPVTRFAADELWLLALVAVAGPITALWPAWRASQRRHVDQASPVQLP